MVTTQRELAGEAHQADVLREAGVGEGVEDAAQQGGQAVGALGVGDVTWGDTLAHDLAGREHVTRGLHGGHGHDDDHRDDGSLRTGGRKKGWVTATQLAFRRLRGSGLAHREAAPVWRGRGGPSVPMTHEKRGAG